MKRSRFSEEQIIHCPTGYCVAMSREGDIERASGWAWCEGAVPQALHPLAGKRMEHSLRSSDATFYKWRSKFGGMEVSDARKLKALEAENAKLKKLLAEQMMRCTAGHCAAMSREWMCRH